MPSEELRARYRAMKSNGNTRTVRGHVARLQAKADLRARQMIERWQAGETHRQIAATLGIAEQDISSAISRYRKRHPDCPIPVGRQDRNEESE